MARASFTCGPLYRFHTTRTLPARSTARTVSAVRFSGVPRAAVPATTIGPKTKDTGTLDSSSLRDAIVYAALPALDLDRAKRFFEDKLGLAAASETESTVMYAVPAGQIVLFLSNGRPSGTHTQIGWVVDDIESTVAELRERGVVFVEYNEPGFETFNGIATFGENRYAWFTDTEGNMHGIAQFAEGEFARNPAVGR